jgi:hypothetical protein
MGRVVFRMSVMMRAQAMAQVAPRVIRPSMRNSAVNVCPWGSCKRIAQPQPDVREWLMDPSVQMPM